MIVLSCQFNKFGKNTCNTDFTTHQTTKYTNVNIFFFFFEIKNENNIEKLQNQNKKTKIFLATFKKY